MKVKNILTKKGTTVHTIHPDHSVAEALKLFNDRHIGALIVMDDRDNIAGIVSERDLLRKFAATDSSIKELQVKELMTPKEKLIVGHLDDDIQYLMSVMTNNRIRHVPIIDNGKLVAIVSIGDVIRILLEDAEYENKMLTDYIYQT
jgi:CBS domain-containing protein